MGRILVVDDDTGIQRAIQALLKGRGHEIFIAGSGEAGLEILERERPDIVLIDVWLPGMNGLETLQAIKTRQAGTPIIVMTGSGTMDLAIEASKVGAFDYRLKPFDPTQMLQLIEKALDSVRLAGEPDAAAEEERSASSDLIIGGGAKMQELFRSIGRVAPTDANVLIRGESGTGKELVAKAIRQHSRRSDGPMVMVNCAAIPETLLESELFGFERGAFTGAVGRRVAMFERASGGTILLDEIGDIPLGIQAKILRVLQEKTFERIGGTETVRVDVRILAATNRDLEQAMAAGRFREDLYHRLNVVTIHVPPLRARAEARAGRDLGVGDGAAVRPRLARERSRARALPAPGAHLHPRVRDPARRPAADPRGEAGIDVPGGCPELRGAAPEIPRRLPRLERGARLRAEAHGNDRAGAAPGSAPALERQPEM